MLEPLTALSLAASIVQFIDFGSRLLTAGYGAYRSQNGATAEHSLLEQAYADLKVLSDQLGTPNGASLRKQPSDESALRDLAYQCYVLSSDLLTLLESLKVKTSGPLRSWEAIRQALRSSLKSDRIKAAQTSLERIKTEMGLRLLTIIRSGLSKNIGETTTDAVDPEMIIPQR